MAKLLSDRAIKKLKRITQIVERMEPRSSSSLGGDRIHNPSPLQPTPHYQAFAVIVTHVGGLEYTVDIGDGGDSILAKTGVTAYEQSEIPEHTASQPLALGTSVLLVGVRDYLQASGIKWCIVPGNVNPTYPFQTTVHSDNTQIIIGENRADLDYLLFDHITVGNDILAKTVAEQITVAVSAFVYYNITKSSTVITATPSVSATWPSSSDGNVNYVLGYASCADGEITVWQPHHLSGHIAIDFDLVAESGEDNLAYPFEGSIVGNTIKIGADRAAASYYFADHIMCGNDKLAKTTAETTSTISATSFVYYACTKSSATITATLSHKTVASGWPTDSDGTENYMLGVAVYSGSITSWEPAHISGQIRIGSARVS